MPTEPNPLQSQDRKSPSQPSALSQRLRHLWALYSGSGARSGYLAAIDQAVISLSNFLATILIARNTSPTELGVYGVGFIAINLTRAFQEGIVVQPLNVFGAGLDEASFKRYFSSNALLQAILAFSLAAGAALGGWVLIVTGNDTAGPALFALWFAILNWQFQEFFRRVLYTRGRVANALFNTVLANLARLGIMLWWAAQGSLSGAAGLTIIGWGALVALIPGIWFTRIYWTRAAYSLGYTWRNNWGFGRWVMGGSIANWISVEFYPVLTAGMISFAAAGAYRALQNLVAPIHLLLRAIDTYLTPRAARSYDQSGLPAVGRLLRLIYMVTSLPILGILTAAVLFREQLLRFLYGDTYLPYSSGMVLMVIFYALLYAYGPLQSGFKAMRRSQPIFAANLAAMLCMFTLGVIAIQTWGVYGTLAGQVLNAAVVSLILWGSWIAASRKAAQSRSD